MADKFQGYGSGMDSPARSYVKISSGVAFDTCRALWVGTAGTATIIDADGGTATNFPLLQGLNPIRATTVTLGSAADVWAMY